MRIDIWSDVICPFCYLGKRYLEGALADFEHRDRVEVVWHSFELDPTPRQGSDSLIDGLVQKYGASREKIISSQEDLARRFTQVGLTFNWQDAKPGNTLNAHRIIQAATQKNLANRAWEVLKTAYFEQGTAISDDAELRRLAAEIGLDVEDIENIFTTDAYTAEVRADEEIARQLGISGVPFFLIDQKYAVNGAQPTPVLLDALNQVWEREYAAAKPQFINIPGAEDAPICEPGQNC